MNFTPPLFIWIVGLIASGFGIYRICKSLSVIQNVAVTSEGTWLQRIVEAFKIAGKELEEERKPKLELKFRGVKPPFRIGKGQEKVFNFELSLTHGEVARFLQVYFAAPPEFTLIGDEAAASPSSPKYSHLTSACWVNCDEPLKRGTYLYSSIRIKAPSESKTSTLMYMLVCEGFWGEKQEFEVVVE